MATDGAPPSCLLVLPDKVLERLSELTAAPLVHGVRFVTWQPGQPTAGFGVVLHKAAYDSAVFLSDPSASARLNALFGCGSPLIDPLDRVARFADRGAICHSIAQLQAGLQRGRDGVG